MTQHAAQEVANHRLVHYIGGGERGGVSHSHLFKGDFNLQLTLVQLVIGRLLISFLEVPYLVKRGEPHNLQKSSKNN